MKKLLWVLLILAVLAPGAATATVVFTEDFPYDPGTLLTATGNWSAHSGSGTNAIATASFGLTYPGYPASAGNAASMTTSGEDDHTTAAFTLNSGSVYYAFLANFTNAQATGDYFSHLYQSSSLFYGRVYAKLVSGSLNFGVTRGSGTANYSATPFALNQTHLIVVKYTFVGGTLNDTADLWVDPVISPVEPSPLVSNTDVASTDATSFIAVSLRQGSATNAPTQVVDGIRLGTSWSEVVYGIAAGACCAPDGACTITVEADCMAPNVWHGEWTGCSPNPCPQPMGACCAPDGGCTMTIQANCAAPSVWHGEWAACDPNPCPQPSGACCVGEICSFVPQAECAGTWLGMGSTCDPNPCVVPVGACCAPDGNCVITPEAQCVAPSVWHGDWSACDPNPCPQPPGACCASDGSCTFVLQAECAGSWLGFGTVCDPNPCPQPPGACCAPNGACTFVPQAECSGTWLGQGSVCDPNPCPQPGACCLPDYTCQVMLQAECQAAGGTWDGSVTTCTPSPCPPMPATLCQVAADDANGVPVLLNRKVEIEGIALVNSGTWSGTTQDFQMTDGECCIDVFGGSINPVVAIGDRVHVIGTVIQFNGKTEVSNPGLVVTIISSNNPVPDPFYVTTGDLALNGENYESCFIGVHCVRIVGGTWPAAGSNGTVQIDDGTGPVDLFIDRDTNVDGSPQPTVPFSVIGIGQQFDSSSPYTSGYEIVPRSLNDFTYNCQGACCYHSGTCEFLPELECTQSGGTWSGVGTSCSPNPCPQPLGACCNPATGECTLTEQANCPAPLSWQGIDTVCEPNPCLQPIGACCAPIGTCTRTYEMDCHAPSIWQGPDTTCDPNPCPQPLGACCNQYGECAMLLQADCVAPSYWAGPFVACDPNPCIQPVAACCFSDGSCQLLTATECQGLGEWHFEWTTCDPNPCVVPMGACCSPNGTCNYVPQNQCLPPNSFIAGVTCEPNPCPQPTGACCSPIDGACTVVPQAQCPTGWQWLLGQVCDPNPCPIPVLGACCLGTGECVFTSQAGCDALSGTYYGDGVSCTPNPCPPPVPTERSTWGRIKDSYR